MAANATSQVDIGLLNIEGSDYRLTRAVWSEYHTSGSTVTSESVVIVSSLAILLYDYSKYLISGMNTIELRKPSVLTMDNEVSVGVSHSKY